MHGEPTCRKNPTLCSSFLLGFLIVFLLSFRHGCCKSDIHTGYRLTLAVPVEYTVGFIGRAFLIESNQMAPNFKTALSVEAVNGKYSCSLQVFLGDVKVWNSGHYSHFYVSEKCVLELTQAGDLKLKGPKNRVGWRTGTSRQGVERLQILKTGNLVLLDALNLIKWQSFNFPTDVILWGQSLNLATRLTSFPTNSTEFYTFEIQYDKIALYLHSGKWNYSYWEFKPSKNRNITYIVLGSKGLEVYNDKAKKIAQIFSSQQLDPLRFLALGNKTGNFGLYYFSEDDYNFKAAFQAINDTCDLPLACKPCDICTFSNTCSSIHLLTQKHKKNSGCGEGAPGEVLCGRDKVEMLEFHGVTSVLKDAPRRVNVSKDLCANLCIDDCECVAALYSSDTKECKIYGVVIGVKQFEGGNGLSYMVKVQKGIHTSHGKSNLKKWVMILVGVVDGLIILLVFGGLAYYLIQKRRKKLLATGNNNTS
ncbi:G-type lectin S-receptor-like serine/threonine-protein kinase SD2-5 [Mangifera indica]|uniref:G-type lectin S-receptor-like serine/threonine-protein kinase SD2-5 n=1 Tax=Mangifera indica TaxID=29780 RepID=UPI001CFBD275|nr:G-type lectin S-receptor-like serine/threonine-protein kinase SD2-5 [Mangifera indica]